MMKELNILFEKYKFDFIYINTKDIDKISWKFIPEEIFTDFVGPPGYIGTLTLENGIDIEVYSDKKITPGDVIFKYRSIKNERHVKLSKLFDSTHDSID